MGFRITGVKPDAIRLKDGRFVNEYMMVADFSSSSSFGTEICFTARKYVLPSISFLALYTLP